jgi:type III restriction enzyme
MNATTSDASTDIKDPVIDSPFVAPARHFKFEDGEITGEIAEGRRPSQYFMAVPAPRRKTKAAKQTSLEGFAEDKVVENSEINYLRMKVGHWRSQGYPGAASVSKRLLRHWTDENRERKLFFCQVEALETAIYITEAADKLGDTRPKSYLREVNAESNAGLPRMAFKMATGSGKTVVMAMLIAWHMLNKAANPQDGRFSDAFLLVAPGITIRDRLRVLLPSDSANYYAAMNIVPQDFEEEIKRAKVVITNYHGFLLREKTDASKLTKIVSGQLESGASTESPDEMVRRVCREFGSKKNIIILNDEAHHCYKARAAPDEVADELKGDDKKEAQEREEEARVWFGGIQAIHKKVGLRAVYDLSATPFYLKGSGVAEGTLFQWVVTDFSLIDAIEAGVVKVPRLPVADDASRGNQSDLPTYRDLWVNIRDSLPKKGRGTAAVGGRPVLPEKLEGAIQSLYQHYRKVYAVWDEAPTSRGADQMPPVFIVVCNNTSVSKLVFDYIAGWEETLADGAVYVQPGACDVFSNAREGRWSHRPSTILVDSEQLERGIAMSDEFKALAAREIEEFKRELQQRFPGRSADNLSDSDLLREVMNTVGKPGKLGEPVKCVVSVSMLTEGWDTNTVSHILGVRAFGTQLLCEQVVGRGLRRVSYEPIRKEVSHGGKTVTIETFGTEYAEVYGVPFKFIPGSGGRDPPKPSPKTHVRALAERSSAEISFPRVMGYRYELPMDRLTAIFDTTHKQVLSAENVPLTVENAPIVGESVIHTLNDLRSRREQEVAFLLTRNVLQRYFHATDGEARTGEGESARDCKVWLFPQVLGIVRHWLAECVVCKDNAFRQLLLLSQIGNEATEKIYRAIVTGSEGERRLLPILRPYDTVGSTRSVDFMTSKVTFRTSSLSQVSHVPMDSGWEGDVAFALQNTDALPEVLAYVKNQNLGFGIPYSFRGEDRLYMPDFIVRLNTRALDGIEEPLNLIVEVSGERRKDKAEKVATAKELWVPAVNNHGGLGRWDFVEIADPHETQAVIRARLRAAPADATSTA